MGDKDFQINAVGQTISGAIQAGNLGGSPISKKPSYLVTIEDTTSAGKKSMKRFITTDKPDLLQGFIQVKGFFSDEGEDEIINNLSDILTSTKKELICEMMFPWHKICSIRSLVFNAIKSQTLVK